MASLQWILSKNEHPLLLKDLYLVAGHHGLQGLYDAPQSATLTTDLNPSDSRHQVLIRARQELLEYFDGKRTKFDLPLDLQGTLFQKKVWEELLKIPFGSTISYSELATRIDNRNAVRAVGTANGKNPIWIIVPCHRVIGADGGLGGYAGGLEMKKQLLSLESRQQ